MWDNREGKRNPKAPDFKCRDKSCDGAVWLDKGDKRSKPQGKPTGQSQSTQPAYQAQPKRKALTKDEFWALQREFLALGVMVVKQVRDENKLGLSDYEIAGLAQDMQAQALIALEKGVWAVDVPEQGKPDDAQPAAKLGDAAAGYVETLNVCLTEKDCDGVRTMFMQDANVTAEERQELLRLWMGRKRKLTSTD
jgi:hypothetical protein